MSETSQKICREIWDTVYRPSLWERAFAGLFIGGGLAFVFALCLWNERLKPGKYCLALIRTLSQGPAWVVLTAAGVICLAAAAAVYFARVKNAPTVWNDPRFAAACRRKISARLRERGIDSWRKFDLLLAEIEASLEKNQTEKEQRIRNASRAFFLCAWVPMGFLFAQTFGKVYGQAFSGDAAQLQREMEAMLEFTITVVGYAIALGVAAIGISWVVTSALQVSVAGKINQKQCVVAYLKEMRYQASGETDCPRRQTGPRVRGRARRKNTRGGPLPGVE